jgi:RNA polymerase sigma-70 factor (ECF subfamily)
MRKPSKRRGAASALPSRFKPAQDGAKVAARFDRLYREQVDRIHRFAQRMCGPGEDARDVVQETFLNAYRGLKDFRGDAQASTWLYAIAARACMRMRRKRKSAPDRELSLDEFIPTSEGEFRLQVKTDGLSPEETLANKQLRRALEGAIRALPRKYQLVLVLRDMEGLSGKQVAEIMSLGERAVKSRLHRARLFVRRELSARGVASPSDRSGERSGDKP